MTELPERLLTLATTLDRCQWHAITAAQDCREAARRLKELEAEVERLRQSVKCLSDYARDTWTYWDADQDHKVGKRLKAMAGKSPGYSAEVDIALTEIESRVAASAAKEK